MMTMIVKLSESPKHGPAKRRTLYIIFFTLYLIGMSVVGASSFYRDQSQSPDCDVLGWFPEDFGLKDHSVFFYDGYYYIVSNHIPGEKYFAYGRSLNLCHWENLSPVLSTWTGSWDNHAIWAPYVLEDNEIYYLFYTGVKGSYPNLTQSIMLATSINPSDPTSWTVEGMIFQPDHPGMVWEDNLWAECHDPMVFKVGDIYHMYYTGVDITGGIVGIAKATSPLGPWTDFGSIVSLEDLGIAESPTIWQAYEGFYIFYNRISDGRPQGEMYRFGPTPMGPWSNEYPISPGWAHEIWNGLDGRTLTSFLTDYSVTIETLLWNEQFETPRPWIGEYLIDVYVPLVSR